MALSLGVEGQSLLHHRSLSQGWRSLRERHLSYGEATMERLKIMLELAVRVLKAVYNTLFA